MEGKCKYCGETEVKGKKKYKRFCSNTCYTKFKYHNNLSYRKNQLERAKKKLQDSDYKEKARKYMRKYMRNRRRSDSSFKERTNKHSRDYRRKLLKSSSCMED